MTRPIPLATLAAAEWLSKHWREAAQSPSMAGLIRKRFALNLDQSIKAIAEAKRMMEEGP